MVSRRGNFSPGGCDSQESICDGRKEFLVRECPLFEVTPFPFIEQILKETENDKDESANEHIDDIVSLGASDDGDFRVSDRTLRALRDVLMRIDMLLANIGPQRCTSSLSRLYAQLDALALGYFYCSGPPMCVTTS